MAAHFELYRDGGNEFRWRFRADNGQILADSGEGYTSKDDCQRGIDRLKQQVPAAVVEDHTAR